MNRVCQAEPYRAYKLESLGDANAMLIRQYRFPNTYDQYKDRMTHVDHDRVIYEDYEKAFACFQKHTGTGDLGFGHWVRSAKPEQVIVFMREFMPLSNVANFAATGFRVLGTKNRSNGQTVWGLELFEKSPETKTQVYSTEEAPNVQRPARRQVVDMHGRPTLICD